MSYPTENLGFSIITNFGCGKNCWYCIWKHHSLKDYKADTDWEHLKKAISHFKFHRNLKKISVSGGGDPLFDYENNSKWWNSLFLLCDGLGLAIDVHTGILLPVEKITVFRKYILHLDYGGFLKNKDSLRNFPIPLRLTFVMTKNDLPKPYADGIAEFASDNNYEVGFRQLFIPGQDVPANPLKNWWKDAEKKFPNHKIKFIKQSDYNTYYMPDNQVYGDFMCNSYGMIMA